jgi:hypothetical protein
MWEKRAKVETIGWAGAGGDGSLIILSWVTPGFRIAA